MAARRLTVIGLFPSAMGPPRFFSGADDGRLISVTGIVRGVAEYEATLRERSRLAAKLHDTILGTVTGSGFQLRAGITSHAAEPGEESLLDRVTLGQKMVDHAASQLRGTVWSLRSLPLDGSSFSEALEALVQRLGKRQEARIALFGSRTDPVRRGGHIDPVIEIDPRHPADHHRLTQRLQIALEDEICPAGRPGGPRDAAATVLV